MFRETTITTKIEELPITLTVSEPTMMTEMALAYRIPDGDPDYWTMKEHAEFLIEITDTCTEINRELLEQLPGTVQIDLGTKVCDQLNRWDRIDQREDREFMDAHDGAPSIDDIHAHVTGGNDEVDP